MVQMWSSNYVIEMGPPLILVKMRERLHSEWEIWRFHTSALNAVSSSMIFIEVICKDALSATLNQSGKNNLFLLMKPSGKNAFFSEGQFVLFTTDAAAA